MSEKKKKNETEEEILKEETPEETAPAEESAPAEETAAEEEAAGLPETDPLQAQLEETKDQLMRTLAEYDNFRKRSQKEKEALYADIKAETIGKLLPVADNLERAALAEGDFESYKKGIEMTVKQLFDILKNLGVESFGEKGEPFDPNLHNGVMHEDDEALPENSISEVFMKGYKMGDKVIRHATVKVAN